MHYSKNTVNTLKQKQDISNMRLNLKKLNSVGFTHHALIALFVMFSVAGIGAYRVWQSSAATVNSENLVKVVTENGCWLAGRTYDTTKKDCANTCRNAAAGTFKTKVGSDGTTRGFCTNAVAETMTAEDCTVTLHRYYVTEIGCARRVDQDNTNNARQCLPGYPNYVADGAKDKCVAATIAPAPTTSSSAPTADTIDKTTCLNLGRTANSSAVNCNRACATDTGTLLIGPSSKQYYCDKAVAVITETRCVELHRAWLTDGCARRADQKDTNNASQCLSGYPYYNANYNNGSTSTQTSTDICEKSQAEATANETNGTPGGKPASTTGDTATEDPSDPSTNTGDDSGDEGGCAASKVIAGHEVCDSDPVITQPPLDQTELQVDGSISPKLCDLLGRQFVQGTKEAPGGCSMNRCQKQKDGVKMKRNNGIEYCEGYVVKLEKSKCNELHRKWVDEVKACATFYNQDRKKKTILNAEQCTKPFTTYVLHSESEGRDECLKPSTVQKLQGVAKASGKPFTYVASLPPKGVCKLRPGMIWDHGKCIKKPKPATQSSSSAPSQNDATDITPATTNQAYCESTLGRKWSGGTCTRACKQSGYVITNYSDSSKWDKCYKPSSTDTTPSCPDGMILVGENCVGHGGPAPGNPDGVGDANNSNCERRSFWNARKQDCTVHCMLTSAVLPPSSARVRYCNSYQSSLHS